jgi:L-asparaginase/Glu-tRNA(Gln) amidotransferase subunit D
MKKICWLATGGTIASRPSENGLAPGFTRNVRDGTEFKRLWSYRLL